MHHINKPDTSKMLCGIDVVKPNSNWSMRNFVMIDQVNNTHHKLCSKCLKKLNK